MNTALGCLTVAALGLLIRQILFITQQLWVSTFQQLITFIILPVITYIITHVIAGDVSLALGMVGALSIVRFRNPVKNTLELVIYFSLITIGIAGSINLKYSIFLSLFICLTVFIFHKLNKYLLGKDINKFTLSFNEGDILHTLEAESSFDIDARYKNEMLTEETYDNENKRYFYRFVSNNKEKISDLKQELNKLNLSKVSVSYY